MDGDFASSYLRDVEQRFHGLKSLADRALSQVKDDELSVAIDEESNSIAILMKHISGNMIHRWTDPFAPPEKRPPRDRDMEFTVTEEDTKTALFERWEEAWSAFFKSLGRFDPGDLGRIVTHAGREYTLLEALNDQLVHYAGHVGQIIFLAKHFRGRDWQSLSIPRKR
ncbi:hypothetical protein AC482_05500 [miscellaneous Crenarchaeota group-15 archaeon DG-45]|uniref:DUF1572 domain-containing protein n=1 Tax=miscellaneous Crenarchaeota group-15 archaeon DG-45 TaxID=1685127 RepID=A0A0M0BMM6_9ARCH|nr:MAG: hypothetical protein AC482_05500 [miscellaneous Crenarchaeota group-15 archaeon DG-45]